MISLDGIWMQNRTIALLLHYYIVASNPLLLICLSMCEQIDKLEDGHPGRYRVTAVYSNGGEVVEEYNTVNFTSHMSNKSSMCPVHMYAAGFKSCMSSCCVCGGHFPV